MNKEESVRKHSSAVFLVLIPYTVLAGLPSALPIGDTVGGQGRPGFTETGNAGDSLGRRQRAKSAVELLPRAWLRLDHPAPRSKL